MEKPGRVLIIGGKQAFLQKAKALGLEVLYIQKKEQFEASHLAVADQVVLMDYQDVPALLLIAKALHAAFPFEYAISMYEEGLIPAACVREALQLPGNTVATVQLLKDKWVMRQRLNEMNLSPVSARMAKSLEQIRESVREYGLPVIVKPVDGSGSLGIVLLRDEMEIEPAWGRLQALGNTEVLVEEFLDGPEISVEAFSFHGRHVVLAVTDKLTLPNFVEVGHSIPAQVSGAAYQEVIALVTAFLDAVGIQEGPTHTELRLTPRGPRIIESHDRRGGDRINDLVLTVYGVDMESLALAWPFRLAEALQAAPAPTGGAAIRFLTPPPGRVRAILGVEKVRSAPGTVAVEVAVEVGGLVPPVRWSPDRSGHVIAAAATVQEAVVLCEQKVAEIQIVVA